VRDALERRLRWLFGTAAATFALFAIGIPLVLAGSTGGVLDLGAGAERWAPLAAGYGVVAAVLAAKIARAPRRETFLMPVLALGAATSGIALLVPIVSPWANDAGGEADRLALAGAALDLAGAALFSGAWLRLWLAATPGDVREERDEAILMALLETIVPQGGAIPIGAADARLRERILARRPDRAASEVRIRLELRTLDLASRLEGGEALATASPDVRARAFERLLGSRFVTLRSLARRWRDVTLAAFYADDGVQDAIGFDRRHLERRLEEGPNREAHRARLVERGARETRESRESREGESSAATPAQPSMTRAEPADGPSPLRLIRTGAPLPR